MEVSKLWLDEYNQKGIPSSFRDEPSGTVVEFLKFLKKKGLSKGRALDLGCGRGRNSFYLNRSGFQVDCIDIVPDNISFISQYASEKDLQISAICQSITDKLPYEDEVFDVVIDIFCYKHQTDKDLQSKYRSELHRVMKPTGLYLLSLAGIDDGFYGPELKHSSNPEIGLITDPVTKIDSLLYSTEGLIEEFSPQFETVYHENKQQKGPMHGSYYERSTLAFYLQKKLAVDFRN